jgi:hypothetical protein|tara:strand:+ start:42 stop:392 length:351 start_codon:yes stop_codon:yes gene_type:complete
MIEISIADIIAAFTGIVLFWILVYSAEKDKFDATDEKHKFGSWCKNWWNKNNDNVLAHFFVCAFLLIIGIENTTTLLSKHFDVPQDLSHVGASGLIGFSSSLIADLLKRMIKSVKK